MSKNPEETSVCETENAASSEEAIFHWDIAHDRLHWNAAARNVLQLDEGADISSSRAWMLLVDPSHASLRQDAMTSASRRGQRDYVISYRFMPLGRGEDRGFMVVERGWWTLDAKGKPAHVFGSIQRIGCNGETSCSIPGLPEMDPSSGLFCRSYFFKQLERFLREDAAQQRHAAILLISLRNFSIIFDAYGFEAADATYAEVARRMNNVLRAGDIISRYGENRIAMLLHDCTEEDLGPAMQRFLQAPTQEPVETEKAPIWPMLAMGAVMVPKQARTLTEAITCAEEALSEAEGAPGNNAVVFNTASSKTSQRAMKARFSNEIFDALNRRRFTLAFQPIVRADGGIYCHEALLRVFDEHDKPVPAAHLVPVAEELGLIRQVDMEVLHLALQALREQPGDCLSINVSAMTALTADAFLDTLSEHADLVRGRLIVEITESSMLDKAEQINHVIERLHALGCRVALDDFGAGYTSFRNLRDFHFDIVKIDGAFCENLSENAENQHFVRSLIELARNIDIHIIAEWVESEKDAELLRQWGVDAMQGYLFGKAGDGAWYPPNLQASAEEEQTLVLSAELVAGMEQQPVARQEEEPQPAEQPREESSPEADARPATRDDDTAPQAPESSVPAREDKQEAPASAGEVGELMRELEDDLQRLKQMLAEMRGPASKDAANG